MFKPFRLLCLIASLVFPVSGCMTIQAKEVSSKFDFVVVGDIPYSDDDEAVLKKAVAKLHKDKIPFVIHVGDFKRGGKKCSAKSFGEFAQTNTSIRPRPTFYTPGDNDWTDCDRKIDKKTNKQFSELERLSEIKRLFFSAAPGGIQGMDYQSQAAQAENAAWVYGGVRFLTLHVVGTNNGWNEVLSDPLADAAAAIVKRDTANLDWLMLQTQLAVKNQEGALVIALHADITRPKAGLPLCASASKDEAAHCDSYAGYRAALHLAAQNFKGPVLLIHGDTKPFLLTKDIAGTTLDNMWRLNAAGDRKKNKGVGDVTRVSFDPPAAVPFSAEGYVSGAKPESK